MKCPLRAYPVLRELGIPRALALGAVNRRYMKRLTRQEWFDLGRQKFGDDLMKVKIRKKTKKPFLVVSVKIAI